MTTGEKIVELSGLSTGTAMDHLLAIITGGGTGDVLVEAILEASVSVDSMTCEVLDDSMICEVDEGVLECVVTTTIVNA